MTNSHNLLLLAILGVIVWLIIALSRILRRGQQASKNQMRWREMNEVVAVETTRRTGRTQLSTSMLSSFALPLCSFVSFVVKRFLRFALTRVDSRPKSFLLEEALADPIDGTTFQKNEPVIRCACGAAYHTHSWQWLIENHGGKCVTCKQAS